MGGLTRGEFVAYYLLLILVNQFTYSQTNWTVGDLIRYGQMNRLLLRPMPPIYDVLASEFAGKVVYMMFAIPVVAGLALVLQPEMHFRPETGWRSSRRWLLAWALRFFWGYWPGAAGLLGHPGGCPAGRAGFAHLPAGRPGGADRLAAGLHAGGC